MKYNRDSNMELLRIIAMFLVLLVHADFYSLGAPDSNDCANNTIDATMRVLFEAIAIPCVNIFVCISGWYGIHSNMKSFTNFAFQCLFWLITTYLVSLSLGISKVSLEAIMECFALTKASWFIKAYLLLYILSPVLNSFIENTSRIKCKNVLIGFFLFQTLYGWLFKSATGYIQDGYSTISFIGLYLLARYSRIYKPYYVYFNINKYIIAASLSVLFVLFCYITPPLITGIHTVKLGVIWINYISPYSIVIAMIAVLCFSKIKINNRFINWFASSSFAVYLMHTNPNVFPYFKTFVNLMYNNFSLINFWILVFVLLLILFISTVIIDQLRIYLWRFLCVRFNKPNCQY